MSASLPSRPVPRYSLLTTTQRLLLLVLATRYLLLATRHSLLTTRYLPLAARHAPLTTFLNAGRRWPRFGNVLVPGFPFIEAEVEYAVGEYCRSVKDLLSLRMRLAYINSDAAKEAVPRATELMAKKLGWSKKERAAQEKEAYAYLGEFGGPVPDKFGASLRAAAKADLKVLFKELDADHSGYLDEEEIGQAAAKLGFPFKTKAELQAVQYVST